MARMSLRTASDFSNAALSIRGRPNMITTDKPPAIVQKSEGPTTAEKAALAALSFFDLIQTQKFLHESSPTGRWEAAPFEANPLLGRHPTLARMALTGVALNELVLNIKNPTIRRLSIGMEFGNVVRNVFVVRMSL
jgi:hypothetical protein